MHCVAAGSSYILVLGECASNGSPGEGSVVRGPAASERRFHDNPGTLYHDFNFEVHVCVGSDVRCLD